MLYVRNEVNIAVNDRGRPSRIYHGGEVIPDGVFSPEKAQALIAEGLLTENPLQAAPAEEQMPTVPYDLTNNGVKSVVDRDANNRLRAAKQSMPAPDAPELDDLSIQSHYENDD